MRARAAPLVALALLCSGCLGGNDDPAPAEPTPPPAEPAPAPQPTQTPEPPRDEPLEPARCPPELDNCRTASGRIVYVERVDPDGDGDAHFVLTSRQSITLPGISVIDVKRSLRPHPLPGRGDRISAAGPVYRGSFGQRQIEAIELHVARRR